MKERIAAKTETKNSGKVAKRFNDRLFPVDPAEEAEEAYRLQEYAADMLLEYNLDKLYRAQAENCPLIPGEDFEKSGKWELACEEGINFSESGIILIRRVLDQEKLRKANDFVKPTPITDQNPFHFVG